jgi:hypothetical protein
VGGWRGGGGGEGDGCATMEACVGCVRWQRAWAAHRGSVHGLRTAVAVHGLRTLAACVGFERWQRAWAAHDGHSVCARNVRRWKGAQVSDDGGSARATRDGGSGQCVEACVGDTRPRSDVGCAPRWQRAWAILQNWQCVHASRRNGTVAAWHVTGPCNTTGRRTASAKLPCARQHTSTLTAPAVATRVPSDSQTAWARGPV